MVPDRKIRELNLRKGQLALTIKEYPQTIISITKGRRGMNTELALKLEKVFGLEEGYFMVLQVIRVMQGGNDQEKNALVEFYGTEKVKKVLTANLRSPN